MNRLLDIRVTDAKESVDRTKDALTKATNRRAEAAGMQQELRRLLLVAPWIGSIEALILYCKKVQGELQDDVQSELRRKIAEADIALTELSKNLQQLQDRAARLNKSSSNTEQLRIHQRRTTELLQNKNEQLGRIRERAQEQKTTPRELLADVESAKPFWGEHIETVAGMILRDERFDDGLCALADHLIDLCRGYAPFGTTDTFNILGREHTVLRELKYTLYFRFPSWSVWGLPLVAHEFWHASSPRVLDDQRMKDLLVNILKAQKLWEMPLVQNCLADAFATFVIGPAYAFACILLLLDVSSAEDRLRAETVFATLNYLAEVKEDAPAYEFRADLRACWNEASGSEFPSPPEEGQIGEMRDAVLHFMPAALRYNAAAWLSDGEDLSGLLEKKIDEQEWGKLLEHVSVSGGVDLRQVLHAAWYDRWNGIGGIGASGGRKTGDVSGSRQCHDQAPARIKQLAQRATQLCHNVAAQRQKPPIVMDDENGSSSGTGLRIITGRG